MNKKLLSYVAPAVGAIGGNFLGNSISSALGVSPAVGAGIGAGLGGFGGSLLGGRGFGQSAGIGALSGLASGVLNSLTSGAAPSTVGGGSAAGAAGAGSGAAAGAPVAPVDLTAELGISPGQMGMLNNASAPLTTGGMDISAGQQAMLNNLSPPPVAATLPATASAAIPAVAAPAAAAAKSGEFNYGQSSLGKIMTSLGLPQNSVTEAIAKNPGALVGGAGLAYNMMQGNKELEGTGELRALAQQANERGQRYSSYLESGQLPAGAQAGLTQATEAAKAAIRSKYAGMNMSGSSAEQQELNSVDMQAQAQGFNMASNLLRTGVQESGIAADLYRALLGLNAQREANTGKAISSFASAMNG